MENPAKMTDLILETVKICSVRVIVSRGWSKLGTGKIDPNVLFLGNYPHGKLQRS
jgi:sterol 3beta-glucosyltransferase